MQHKLFFGKMLGQCSKALLIWISNPVSLWPPVLPLITSPPKALLPPPPSSIAPLPWVGVLPLRSSSWVPEAVQYMSNIENVVAVLQDLVPQSGQPRFPVSAAIFGSSMWDFAKDRVFLDKPHHPVDWSTKCKIWSNLIKSDQIWSNLIKSDQNLIKSDQIWSNLIKSD